MRRKLVVGNWKMHGSKAENTALVSAIATGTAELRNVDVGVCPAYLHIGQVAELLGNASVLLGAQDVFTEKSGAFTGAVSAAMLVEFGVSLVIVGHSERRQIFGDTDASVASKFVVAQQSGLTPILCVGETLQQRQQGATEQVVLAQLDAVVATAGIAAMAAAVIAYEPIWAIGTGQTATPEQAQKVHGLLRQHLAASDKEVAKGVRIIYGGSVKAANARELFRQSDIDGGLVGGASLQAEDFISICKSAD